MLAASRAMLLLPKRVYFFEAEGVVHEVENNVLGLAVVGLSRFGIENILATLLVSIVGRFLTSLRR